MQKTFKSNNSILAKEVRVITDQGEFLGIMSIDKALNTAKEQNLDLVEISSKTSPPLCKICSLARLITDERKKQKLIKKKTKTLSQKSIRIRPTTSKHDLGIKINQAIKFLQKEHQVVFCMKFKGREKLHIDQGRKLLESVIEELSPYCQQQPNKELKLISNQIMIQFDPIKK